MVLDNTDSLLQIIELKEMASNEEDEDVAESDPILPFPNFRQIASLLNRRRRRRRGDWWRRRR